MFGQVSCTSFDRDTLQSFLTLRGGRHFRHRHMSGTIQIHNGFRSCVRKNICQSTERIDIITLFVGSGVLANAHPFPPFHCPNIIVQCLVVWYACVIQEKLPHTHPHPIWVPHFMCFKILEVAWYPHWDPAIWCRHAGIRGGAWDQGDLSMAFESDKSCSLWRSSPSPEATSDTLLWTAPLDQCPFERLSGPFRANSRHPYFGSIWKIEKFNEDATCFFWLLFWNGVWFQSNLCTWYTFVWITKIPWLSLVWALALRVAPPVAEAAAPNLSSP